ncbi:probable flavin-containing monoamine oxidase A isoform X2 [Drosophila montana]|uniref:probable flavin-containing monoamine oxidase A isoform X2 n=1 Tax=Drosophila montana TaxID=40370 RepID=UPI00313B371F
MDLPFGNELPQIDVLIVGAGLSGLTSAVKILSKEHSLNVKIIDEHSNPGGQLRGEGTRFSDQDDQTLSRCWELDRGLTSAPAKFELWRYINMLDMRMKKFSSVRYEFRERIPTMERHICINLFFNLSREFMYQLVHLVTGMPASEINYDEFMALCSTSGGLNVLIDLFLAMPQSVLTLSSKKLLEILHEKLKYTEILNNVKAVKVEHFKNYVQVTDSHGKKHKAEAVILAIPWDKVNKLQFEPQLPKQYRIPSRRTKKSKSMITQYSMRYNKSFWISQGYSGQFLNITPLVVGYEHNSIEYCGYMLHTVEEADSVRGTVLDLLAAQFGEEMLEPLHYKQETCELNTAMHKAQIKPWHRVIWSSSAAAATRDRNLMAGAVESGIRAAINALFVIRPQVVCWRDLQDVQDKNRYAGPSPGYFSGLLSRLNLYNITFYGVFVIGLICLLNFGYGSIGG